MSEDPINLRDLQDLEIYFHKLVKNVDEDINLTENEKDHFKCQISDKLSIIEDIRFGQYAAVEA